MIILLLCLSLSVVGKADDFKSESSTDLHYHYYVTESSYVNDKDLYEDFQEYNDIGDDLIGNDQRAFPLKQLVFVFVQCLCFDLGNLAILGWIC